MANSASVSAYVHFDGFDNFMRNAFDKRKIRAGMRKAGRIVARSAQSKVSKSGNGKYPSKRTGRLVKSIAKPFVSRSGFLVRVAPSKLASMEEFYPAFLHYGVTGQTRRRDGRAQVKNGKWRIAPRENYMVDALEDSAGLVRAVLAQAFSEALR